MEIRAFQKKIEDIYFERDSARGLDGTYMWFAEEVGEADEGGEDGGEKGRDAHGARETGRCTVDMA